MADPKEYYTELTDVLRTYMAERFGFNAMEMTSSEIIDKLLETNDKESIRELKYLFETADLVKFAKHLPLMNENDMNLVNAVDFINNTKIEPGCNWFCHYHHFVSSNKRYLPFMVLTIKYSEQ